MDNLIWAIILLVAFIFIFFITVLCGVDVPWDVPYHEGSVLTNRDMLTIFVLVLIAGVFK